MPDHKTIPVKAAVPAAILSTARAIRLREASSWQASLPPHRRIAGFTLAELLVTVGVLALLVLLFTQLFNSAATITTLGGKRMDADSQARQLLDRMAIDFAQMVKRSDVDYYLKSSATAPLRRVLQPGNDRIAFYSGVPGYYPTPSYQSPVSLVAYRVYNPSPTPSPCPNCNKLERMGKGLLWNAATPSPAPVVFMPIPLASPLPSPLPTPMPNPSPTPAWPEVSNATTSWSDSEVIGPQVFRFEYYYLLKNGASSDVPWDTGAGNNAVNGMQDIAAIIIDIAVIDPKSKVLLTDGQLATLTTPGNANFLADYTSGMTPGQLRTQWQNKVNGITTLPRPALSGIRLYERYFYLSQ